MNIKNIFYNQDHINNNFSTPLYVFRVQGGSVLGKSEVGEKSINEGVFCTPHLSCVKAIMVFNISDDEMGDPGKVLVVRATKWRFPEVWEKDHCLNNADRGEIIVEEGEIISTLDCQPSVWLGNFGLEAEDGDDWILPHLPDAYLPIQEDVLDYLNTMYAINFWLYLKYEYPRRK